MQRRVLSVILVFKRLNKRWFLVRKILLKLYQIKARIICFNVVYKYPKNLKFLKSMKNYPKTIFTKNSCSGSKYEIICFNLILQNLPFFLANICQKIIQKIMRNFHVLTKERERRREIPVSNLMT